MDKPTYRVRKHRVKHCMPTFYVATSNGKRAEGTRTYYTEADAQAVADALNAKADA